MPIFNSVGSNYTASQLPSSLNHFNFKAKDQFETTLAKHYDKNIHLTYKAREALFLALQNLKVEQGSYIGINGYTCFALYQAVISAGYKPAYIDIASNEINFGPKELRKALKKYDLKAIVIQNTLGTPCDIEEITKICKPKNIPIIEDAAHSIGMKYRNGKEVGATAMDTILSFSQDKVIDSIAGGALISTSNYAVKYSRLKITRKFKDYLYIPNSLFIRNTYSVGIGKAYSKLLSIFSLTPTPMDGRAEDVRSMNNWHCNLALKGFEQLESNIARRREIAAIYQEGLPKELQLKHFEESIYLRFPLRIKDRSKLVEHLRTVDVHISDTWYDRPIGPARCLHLTNYKKGICPESDSLAEQMINLPTHVNVGREDAHKIVKEINLWLSR